MKVIINVTKSFKSAAKQLLKKYPSLSQDLIKLEKELLLNPRLGVSLENNAYKIRLKILSKGKGESGGARIISLVETSLIIQIQSGSKDVIVNLLSIFDKGDTETITDKELKDLIATFKMNNH